MNALDAGVLFPEQVLVWQRGRALHTRQLLALSAQLHRLLPPSRHYLNLCERHACFIVGFLAALRGGSVTLLPLNRGPETLATISRHHQQPTLITDELVAPLFDQLDSLDLAHDATFDWRVPPEQIVAIVFTSGSTGTPEGHAKSWATIAQIAQRTRELLFKGAGSYSLVATVPCQHNYGFETSILLTLAAGCAVEDQRPFFPADIAEILHRVPEPRVLITTPAHLRACVAAAVRFPALASIVSATAPLDARLASEAESLWQAPVHEIYGCTEAGTMAVRRTIDGDSWQPLRGGHISVVEDSVLFQADYLPQPVALQDVIEPLADGHFRLLGRAADLVKIGGKRASLADLTHQLLTLPGVEDAVVFMPHETGRCAALVVAPTRTREELIGSLAARVDSVFLPRPLRLVAQLPRNAAGKLPREALLAALEARGS